jgi:hypothetical protein
MASIIKANLNLAAIPKDKIYKGKKGSYLPITITINDELGNFVFDSLSSLDCSTMIGPLSQVHR